MSYWFYFFLSFCVQPLLRELIWFSFKFFGYLSTFGARVCRCFQTCGRMARRKHISRPKYIVVDLRALSSLFVLDTTVQWDRIFFSHENILFWLKKTRLLRPKIVHWNWERVCSAHAFNSRQFTILWYRWLFNIGQASP